MAEVVIVAAGRTAIGNFNGSLAKTPAADLGAHVIKHLLDKTGVAPAQVDEVIMGHILTAGQGQNTARQAAIKAGLPVEVPAMAINKLCGSGLKATHLAAQAILCGDADIVVAGGQESMTRAAHVMLGGRDGVKMGEIKLYDSMLQDGLHDAFQGYHMGITAENIAEKYGISREEQDHFSVASQNKAEAAQKEADAKAKKDETKMLMRKAILSNKDIVWYDEDHETKLTEHSIDAIACAIAKIKLLLEEE